MYQTAKETVLRNSELLAWMLYFVVFSNETALAVTNRHQHATLPVQRLLDGNIAEMAATACAIETW